MSSWLDDVSAQDDLEAETGALLFTTGTSTYLDACSSVPSSLEDGQSEMLAPASDGIGWDFTALLFVSQLGFVGFFFWLATPAIREYQR